MAKDVADKTDAEAEDGVEGEGEEGGKKKLPLRLIIIGAVAAVLVLGGGGTAAFLLLGHKAPAAATKAAPKKDAKKKGDKKDDKTGAQIAEGPDGVVFYTPPDIVVNMQTADGRPTFLKLKLTLELPDQATADTLDEEHAAAAGHVPDLPARTAPGRPLRQPGQLPVAHGNPATGEPRHRAVQDQHGPD